MRVDCGDHYLDIDWDDLENEDVSNIVADLITWYIKHTAFTGEAILQNDDCTIDAPDILAHIADNYINFKVDITEKGDNDA